MQNSEVLWASNPGELMEDLKTEVEHLKEELSKAKEKEYIFKFGLDRFSSSPEDINFYTGSLTTRHLWHFDITLNLMQQT